MANEIKHDMWDYHPMDGVYNRPCTPEVPECDEVDYHVAHAPSAPMKWNHVGRPLYLHSELSIFTSQNLL